MHWRKRPRAPVHWLSVEPDEQAFGNLRFGLQDRFTESLTLPRLAIGVAPVAFGLPGDLVLDNAGDALVLSCCTCFDVCCRDSVCCCLTFGDLGLNALLLLELRQISRGTKFLPRMSCRHTFLLPCKPGWFSGFFCDTIFMKKGGFCLGSCVAALGGVVVYDVFQV